MIDDRLRDSLRAFDEKALATLANAGLVRRARLDVEGGKVRLVSAADGQASVEADGHLVTMDIRGPGAAPCACRSVAVCRHRIAAVLFLQQAEEANGDQATDEAGDPSAIIIALDLAALERWAGKPAWRAAVELIETAVSVEAGPQSISVEFAGLDDPVRILRGQGFDGIVSKAVKARRKPYHAAAVLAARARFGLPLPEAREAPEQEEQAIEIDAAFLSRVAYALKECASLGFNLAPLPLEESLFELSVSSRIDSLPRLGSMLRAIAAQVRLRRQRSFNFDPDATLELAATAYALTRTLAVPGLERERLSRLAGSVRRSHAPSGPMTLVGCGGEHWRTQAGARGVTAWFLEPASGRWFAASIARGPGQDPMFAPAEAWRTQAMWGADALRILAHARIALTGAGVSADGRLSAPAEAKANLLETSVLPESSWPGVVQRWRGLSEEYRRQTGLGLETTGASTVCLVAIQGSAAAHFDELAQQLIWPVRDVDGEWLALALDHEEPVSRAIEALEARVRPGWEGMALVRLAREGGRLSVTPLTLFDRDGYVDLTLWRPGHAEAARRAAEVRGWFQRLRRGGGAPMSRKTLGPTDMALAAAWRQLLDRAEIGSAQGGSFEKGLAAHAERLGAFGLSEVAGLLRKVQQGQGDELLAAAYGIVLARQQRSEAPVLN